MTDREVAGRRRPKVRTLGAVLAVLSVVLLGCGPHGSTTTGAPGTSSAAGAAAPLASPGGHCPAPSPNVPGARQSKLPLRSLCALPLQAAQVWRTINTGGKLTYSRDGIVFNNAEKRLPLESRGYYHEYTVPTPGAPTRGARRLITGQEQELYYTGDHYSSFVVVDPAASAR